jgi:hypothetical protein
MSMALKALVMCVGSSARAREPLLAVIPGRRNRIVLGYLKQSFANFTNS